MSAEAGGAKSRNTEDMARGMEGEEGRGRRESTTSVAMVRTSKMGKIESVSVNATLVLAIHKTHDRLQSLMPIIYYLYSIQL